MDNIRTPSPKVTGDGFAATSFNVRYKIIDTGNDNATREPIFWILTTIMIRISLRFVSFFFTNGEKKKLRKSDSRTTEAACRLPIPSLMQRQTARVDIARVVVVRSNGYFTGLKNCIIILLYYFISRV